MQAFDAGTNHNLKCRNNSGWVHILEAACNGPVQADEAYPAASSVAEDLASMARIH